MAAPVPENVPGLQAMQTLALVIPTKGFAVPGVQFVHNPDPAVVE